MTPYPVVPEYTLEEKSGKTYPQWDHSRISIQSYKVQVLVRSRQLYTELSLVQDILEKILDSVRELEQLREDT